MNQYRAPICCVGLGFVGLRTAVAFCDAGFEVIGVDTNNDHISDIISGDADQFSAEFNEKVSALLDTGVLQVTTTVSPETVDCETYILSVPTPLTNRMDPDFSFVRGAVHGILETLERGNLVVMQSTVPPGITRNAVVPELEESGLCAGEEFGVAYVPERYSPGDSESLTAPRIVSGITEEWRNTTVELYRKVCDRVIPVSSLEVAEGAKSIENIQRDVNIALINQLTKVFHEKGIDIWETLDAAETKWNFHRYDPGMGVGGNCIPVDPRQFIHSLADRDVDVSLIQTAREINEGMPEFHLAQLEEALTVAGTPLSEATVGILGVSYKPGIKAIRNSPVLEFVEQILSAGGTVHVFDPSFSPREQIIEGELRNSKSVYDATSGADAFVVSFETSHSFDLEQVHEGMASNPVLLDIQANFEPLVAQNIGFLYQRSGIQRRSHRQRRRTPSPTTHE